MKKKKRKLKKTGFLIIILLIALLSFGIYNFFNLSLKNIYVVGNDRVNDSYVIDVLLKEDFLIKDIFFKKNQKELLKNPLINNTKYKYLPLRGLEVEIFEKEIILYERLEDLYITSLGEKLKLKEKIDVPILENYIIDVVQKRFYSEFFKVEKDVFKRISEVKYFPTKYDETRFLFVMNDGNHVVVNIVNLKNINYYVDILKEITKKGTLYLDSKADASQFIPF